MLIQPLLLKQLYIPIRPVELLPEEVKRLRKNLSQQRYRLKRKLGKNSEHLQFPLFWRENPSFEIEDRSSVEDLELDVGPDVVGVGPEIDQPVEWTDEEVLKLSSVLMEESLKALAARDNPSEKMEILGWIFESDYVEEIDVQTPYGLRKKVIYADQVPFTFAFCCKLAGHDPAVYRAHIRRAVPEVTKNFLSYKAEDEPCSHELRYRNPLH